VRIFFKAAVSQNGQHPLTGKEEEPVKKIRKAMIPKREIPRES